MTNEIKLESDDVGKFDIIIFGDHFIILCVLSLCGIAGLMLNLSNIRKEPDKKRDYCLVALKGKVKDESIEKDHILPCSKETSSGMNVEVG